MICRGCDIKTREEGRGVEVSGMSPCWREHLKKICWAAQSVRIELRHGPWSCNWPPAPAIARQKLVGFLRPLATSLIERKPIRSCATPCIQERLDHSPTGLDLIRPLKQD